VLSRKKHPAAAAGPLDHLARVVNIPTVMDGCEVLLTVVARSAAPGRGTGAKVTAAGSHAVAWRVTVGTETVGFLEFAISGLRAIEHPPCAVALKAEIIAVHARLIRATAAGVGVFSLLAVLVYIADEYPAAYARAGAQALEASIVRLYVVLKIVGCFFGGWARGCARLSGVHKQLLMGRAPGCANTCGAISLLTLSV